MPDILLEFHFPPVSAGNQSLPIVAFFLFGCFVVDHFVLICFLIEETNNLYEL